MDVAGLENAAKVGFVGGPGTQPFDRCFFIPERFKESIGKICRVKRLIRQLRDGLFNFNGVQRSTLPAKLPKPCRIAHAMGLKGYLVMGMALIIQYP
jgi:hypothetical protein